jgi:hypothetical protein
MCAGLFPLLAGRSSERPAARHVMGASGSARIKHTKRTGLLPDALREPAHPRVPRVGQRYVPLDPRQRDRAVVRVARVAGDRCRVQSEEDPKAVRLITTSRLLAQDNRGSGRHYRFLGYAPRASYATVAYIVKAMPPWVRIICPEWHPALPIQVPLAALPVGTADAGSWLSCRANLGAASPAGVEPHQFARPSHDFDPQRYPQPSVQDSALEPAHSIETHHDIALFLTEPELAASIAGSGDLYLTGHPPPVAPGARIYLHACGRVQGWREIDKVRKLPNGVRITLCGTWHPVQLAESPRRPRAGVHGGAHGQQRWTRLARMVSES